MCAPRPAGHGLPFGVALAALLPCLLATADAQEVIPDQAALDDQYVHHVRPLLDAYCVQCHNAEKESGGIRLDDIAGRLTPENSPTWADAKDMLDVGSMPPKKAERRPSREEQNLLVTWIGDATRRYEADHRENLGDTLVRRINLRAYANMIQTLLDVPPQGIEDFPEDVATNGFDTVGSGLYTTADLYDLLWKCAGETLDAALPTAALPPPVKTWTNVFKKPYTGAKTKDDKEFESTLKTLEADPKSYVIPQSFCADAIRKTVVEHYHLKAYKELAAKNIDWRLDSDCTAEVIEGLKSGLQNLLKREANISDHQVLAQGLPITVNDTGWYVIGARSACVAEGGYGMPAKLSVTKAGGGFARSEEFMVTEPLASAKDHEMRVWLTPGSYTVNVCNALQAIDVFVTHSHEWQWLAANYGIPSPMCFDWYINDVDSPKDKATKALAYPLRGAALDARGPVFDCWPRPAVTRIFTRGLQEPPSREYAEEIVLSFMKRAYASDCDAATARPYVDLTMSSYEARHDFVAAVKLGIRGILCSPRFLYLCEAQRPDPAQRKPLAATELARRLAGFLWSDLPDETLRQSAASGALLRDDELLAQARRMLKDPRSRALREGFTTQWLKIDKIEHIAFAQNLLPAYDAFLGRSAKEESVAFFSELLDHDLSILDFIDSDFAMLNGRMALHYGIPGVVGDEFRRVQLPPGSHRGGVLGQASVLMATSNGMVSSVVRRGAFIMQQLLGVDPGSPPKNVPALRQAAHRQARRLALHPA